MAIRKLKNCGRRKAIFGSDTAAILAAAGINVAGTMAASAISASATKQAAQNQANATIQSAQKQAQAIKDQSAKSKELQQESQDFVKEQNAENRELQKDIQLQLQMLTGQQNVNDRFEASKIQVKNGGSTKRKLRLGGKSPSLLRGSYYSNNGNLPFKVPHNGNLKYVKSTSEGYDLYGIYGPNHDEGGVDIDFIDGTKIEAEGDKIRTGRNKRKLRLGGEYMLDTKDTAYFISQHDIAGVNPAELVDRGMHPLQAYAIQEQLKAIKGISDDGKHNSSPVEKKLLGGEPNYLYAMYNQIGPQMGVDTVGDTTVGVASQVTDKKRSLKCGGKTRHKTSNGLKWNWNTGKWEGSVAHDNIQVPYAPGKQPSATTTDTSTEGNSATRGRGFFSDWTAENTVDLIGSGVGALGNIGGALITSSANRSAARTVADAQNRAANLMADAYRSLTGIDMNSIRREDYAAAHAMPVLQAPVSFAKQGISKIDRSLQRTLANAGKYSTSGASVQEIMSRAEVNAQDARNEVYSEDQRQMQNIRQANAERVSRAAELYAQLDTQANKEYASAYLNALQYNNDINNQKILGAAGALSEGAINSANTMSAAQTSNAQALANALLGGTQGFVNSLSAMADRKSKLASALLGAGSDSQASYYATVSSEGEARREYNALITQYKAATDEDTKKRLARQINNIASKRGYKLV